MKYWRPTFKALRDKADNLFSLWVRRRDIRSTGHCHLCEKPIECVSHLFTRSTYALRWDDRASFGSCFGCNRNHEERPEVYTSWFLNKYGAELYQELFRVHHTAEKVGRERLEGIVLELRNKLEG